MDRFEDLVERGTHFMLQALDASEREVLVRLETGAATGDVKTLQMLQLQRAVLAVGMFSMLEAHLRRPGDGRYAFNEVAARLEEAGEPSLGGEFTVIKHAINTLKHGRGSSYAALTEIPVDRLPFRIKREGEFFFSGG